MAFFLLVGVVGTGTALGGAFPALLVLNAVDIFLAKPIIKVAMAGVGIEGNTLTAVTNTMFTSGKTTITYQWWLDGVPIPGAVNRTYLLTQANVGKYIFVVACLADEDTRWPWNTNYYKAESLHGLVENLNNPVSGVVTIAGTPIQNQVLSASNTLRDADGVGPVTYTWIRDAAPQNTLPTGAVGFTGRLARTNVLTAVNTLADIDGLGPITYTWYRSGVEIATGPTYTLGHADVDNRLTITANYVDGLGVAQSVTSPQTGVVAPRVTIRSVDTPSLAYLAENAIVDAATAITYQWRIVGKSYIVTTGPLYPRYATSNTFTVTAEYTNTSGVFIQETSRPTRYAGSVVNYTPPISLDPLAVELGTINGERIATGSTYRLTQADVGYYIRAIASYTDSFNHVTNVVSLKTSQVANANDPVAGEVTIDGTPAQYQILTVNTSGLSDADGLGAFSYQWMRNGSNISGATGYNYTLAVVDVGCYITVTASFTDGDGAIESKTSASTNAVEHVNTLPTGTVIVSGTPAQNQILTISNTLADVDGMGPISYQWNLNGSPKWGFTGTTYLLTQAEVGKTISVTASYTDSFGIQESYTSAATAPVANANDPVTGAVYIIGNAVQYQVLTAIAEGLSAILPGLSDVDGLGTFSYQWKRSNGNTFDNIQGATARTYALTQADVGRGLKVTVSYTDGLGTAESSTSSVTALVVNVQDSPTGSVTITGTPIEDQVLTLTDTIGDMDGIQGQVAYQWRRNGTTITGANGATYTLTQGDVGQTITVTATYYDGYGTYEIITSNKMGPIANALDALTGEISINGTAEQYGALFADTSQLSDADGMGTLAYQWTRNGNPIWGANGSSYWLNQDDVGKQISVVVISTDLLGSQETKTTSSVNPTNTNDAPTGNVIITGTLAQYQALIANTSGLSDLDGVGPITYQWLRDGVAVPGATYSTYTLSQTDVGTSMSVTASYTDSYGNNESKTSARTNWVANVVDIPTGSVTITGTVAYNQVLTATNNLSDLDGIGALYYEWKRNGANISGATGTGPTYRLTLDDVGKQMTVIAYYFDGTGIEKSVPSAPTAPVVRISIPSTGAVTLDGTPIQNQALTANISAISDLDGISSFSYQWYRNGVNVSGAYNTARFYVMGASDVGCTIYVKVNITDELGDVVNMTSPPSATVISSPNTTSFNGVFITGTLQQGSTLTASNTLYDVDGIEWVKYKWQRSWGFVYGNTNTFHGSSTEFDDILDATNDTYTLVQADVRRKIRLVAIYLYTDWHPSNTVQAYSAVSVPVANVNDSLTGAVSITGIPTQKEWLQVQTTLYDPDASGIIYQWQRNGIDIPGATGFSYRLVQDDVGKQITVTAKSTDTYGNIEFRTTAPTAVIANANDFPTGSVTIDGIPQRNQVLRATIRNISDLDGIASAFSYQWSLNFEDIVGATGSTYTTSTADIALPLMVTVKYTDITGVNESIISEPVFITHVNTLPVGKVLITGTPARYQLLTASNSLTDVDGKGAVSYTWKRNGTQIATGSTYILTLADVGKQITATASYSDDFTLESVTSDPTTTVIYANSPVTGDVTISGTPAQYQVLTADTSGLSDIDGLGAFSYQWIRGTETILGATASTYTLTQTEVGKVIYVNVSYIDLQGTTESKTSAATATVVDANDLPTGDVTISGIALQGSTLTASNTLDDPNGMGTVSYRWYFNGVSKFGAVGPTYTLLEADVGKIVTVTASYTDLTGVAESKTSAATAAVENVNDPLVGRVSINGTAEQGQRLTVNISGISDLDGRGAYSYMWMRDGTVVGTVSGYTLTQADVGKQITLFVSYTDLRGTYESSTSLPTLVVANVNDSPTGVVLFIDGTPKQNELLTATIIGTLSDADGLGQLSYKWMRNGLQIDSATNSTYRLVHADVGKQITVSISYTDGFGTLETILSNAATTTVINANDSPTGTVTISGIAAQYQILTASNAIADLDGMGTVSYRWKRNGLHIATGTSYTLTLADVGSTMTVTAVYTDLLGTYEGVGITSAPTAVVVHVNTSVTGEVTISRTSPVTGEVTTTGTPKENELLTAITDGLSDVDGLGPFSYQWKSNGVDIMDATDSTYTLTQAMVGKTISVKVSYIDLRGNAESKTSAATAAVVNMNDLPVGIVTIIGTAEVSQLLTVSLSLYDADGLGTVSYQWKRAGYNISGATGSTYTLTPDDASQYITVAASYTDLQGTAESAISDAVGPVIIVDNPVTGGVTIIGTPVQNQVLTFSSTLQDIDGIDSIEYIWKNNNEMQLGTGTSYTLTQSDVGSTIKVVAVCRDMQGHTVFRASDLTAIVVNANDSPTGSVIIGGTPTQHEILYADIGEILDLDGMTDAVTYQWIRDAEIISGATDSIYTLVESDVGKQIRVTVQYTDGFGALETVTSDPTAAVANVNDLPTGSVTISGTATQGELLTVSNTLADIDGLGPISYQWKRGATAISEATGDTYTLVQADVGYAITVVASYTDGHGTVESTTSDATALVVNVNDFPVGSPIITGIQTQGQVLTADTSGISDLDGLGAFSYQWRRKSIGDGQSYVSISGATSATYTLTQDDVSKYIMVVVSYTDGYGRPEIRVSADTAIIANVNDLPTGSVTISGTPTQNQVLTVSHTLVDIDGLGPITYQWKSGGVDISGATGSTYTLVEGDVGKQITVTVSYTDLQGTAESKTSAATAIVANVNDPLIGDVTISGTPTQGELLTASNTFTDADGMGTVSYQWKRGGVAISGATGSTYTLVQADVNSAITVLASYTDGRGTAESKPSNPIASVANVNDLPTGSVTISGTPTENQILTAITSGLSDLDGLGAFSYQWMRAESNISGATASTYTLVQSDVGQAISVKVSYTDLQGTPESKTSAATASVANVNDLPTGSVTISGTPEQNQVLTASNTLGDLDGLGPITYQWKRAGTAISGATGSTYTLVQADVGKYITVTASYTDIQGAAESKTSAATVSIANVNDPLTGSVTIAGTATQGQLLTASNTLADADGMGPITYQWKRGGVAISGATGSGYILVQADVNSAITVTAYYTDLLSGAAESKTSAATAAVANVNDLPTGSVTISGTPTQNQVLTASNTLVDIDGLGPITYQWKRGGAAISGATSATYTLIQADVGSAITVTASYIDLQGAAESKTSAATAAVANVNDSPTGSVTIAGTPTQNQILTASNTLGDLDGLGPITYQWKRGGVAISGATGQTYTLVQADVNSAITVTASYTDLQGIPESATSAATATVTNVNDPVAGEVTISGTPTENQVLTAITSGLSDLDGLGAFSYQWIRAGSNISGATASTYILIQADVGQAISVKVSYTDLQGTPESKTSAATATVVNVNDLPTGSVTISGTPTQNQVLTASNTLGDLDGLGPITYQWKRGGAAISGATSATYTLIQADVGSAITVTVSYIDLQGAAESKTSAATAAVANVNDSPTGSVTIAGTPTQNQILTVSNTLDDLDGLGPITYQWKRGGAAISGATGTTYTLVQADVNSAITVTASYTDLQGIPESATSAATATVANVNDPLTGDVTISGTPTQNQILTAITSGLSDLDGLGAFSYQWMRAESNISGATASTYTLVQADVGQAISVKVSYTDLQGTLESKTSAATATVVNVNDLPTGSVTISGTPEQNQILTASNTLGDLDGLGPITYQWKRAGTAISGATGSTYTLVQADVGKYITVTASYTDIQGAAESKTSAATVSIANVNDPLTGSVTIAGTATQGQLLTASNTLADADGMGPITYQWKRGGVAISGATGSGYILVQADVNSAITVTAYYTDLLSGAAESATSAATGAVANVNDSPTGSVTISGTPTQNQVLTAIISGLSDLDGLGAFSYQWMRTGSNISGATASTYMLVQADVGSVITVTVSYIDLQGTPESKTSAATAVVANVNDSPSGSVTISGTPAQYDVLTVSHTLGDADGLGPISYQWKRDGSAISGATGTSYALVQADVDSAITVTASYTDLQGIPESATSAATATVTNVNDLLTGDVTIAGSPAQNQILTASNTFTDADGMGMVSYQWKRGGVAISGATGSTYTLVQADVNSAITVLASYTDGFGAAESKTSAATAPVANVNDSPSGAVTITGTPTQNQILTASNTLSDIDGLGPITYQWKRGGAAISGATASTYTLVQADVGSAITVTASYTDLHGAAESKTSAATALIANVNDSPTGSVTISGTPTENQVLTVSHTLADIDGLGPITYQWKRGGVAISGATGTTYTLVQADVNSAITVTASYTDLQGIPESATSLATTAVANVNDPLTGDVTISGTPTENQILTAITSGLSDLDGLGAFSYQWMRAGSNISGATASTYTLVQSDVGQAISVKVSYTDLQGTPESKTSAATATVVNVNDLPTGSVTISGTPAQNQILTVSHTLGDLDGLGPITYQWKRGGAAISGATGTTYTLVEADVNSAITVTASYTDLQGTPENKTSAATAAVANVNDSPTGSVTIAGTPTQNQILTVSNTLGDLDGLGPITYQWKRGGVAILGATGSTYTLVQADVNSAITVTASYTDLQGTPESVTSAATATVANVNDSPTGAVTITGTPTQNQVLTASNTLADIDGMGPITYQWKRNGVQSATGTSYTLVQADVGSVITVTASYTDLQGAAESATSAATAIVANVNDSPTGSVTIAGTSAQYQVLTVSHTLGDVDGMGPITYQWKSGGDAISGATGTSYALTQTEVGKIITVTASYTDLHGIPESVTSAATAVVVNVNDSLTGDVTISGTPTQNQVLTAITSGLSDLDGLGAFSYQWMRTGSNISGATASTYTLVQADVGQAISVKVSYTDLQGTPESKTSAATALVVNVNDVPTGDVTISGTPTQNQVLTASNTLVDIDGLGPITYQWKRDAIAISGATSATYTLIQVDVGSAITVTASYTDLQGIPESKTSAATAAVANVNDSPSGSVTIAGTPTQNQILTASNTLGDIDGLGPITYQWKRGGVAISGATGSTYTLVQADVNSSITVTASYTDLQGAAESATSAATALVANVNDSPTGAVTITGTPTQYQVLTVSNTLVDIDGLGPITYQWKRAGSNISGATGSTYTLTQADVGKKITVIASYTDLQGVAESVTSAETALVANVNDSPTGSVTISGTPTQNRVLTASNTLADMDVLGPITYQWKRNGVQIASGTTYTLVQADVGSTITVTASYMDIQGTNESVTSAATALIANVNDPLVGHVMINGDLTQGQTLTASNSFSDVDGFSTAVSYQWLDGGEIISGAVGSTYTLTPVDIGAKISVVASYTDSYGAQEQKTSAETYPIQPIRGYSLQTKGIESVQPTPPVNGKVVIANTSEFAITTSNNATAFSEMTSVEKQAFVKHNVSALLAKYAPSSGSDKLYVSKSLLPFTATSPLTDIVELIDAKSSSIASPLMHVGDASTRAVYIDTAPGSSVTLRYLPDTVTITHTSGTAFSVIINGAAAVNKSIGDKILLKRVVLTLGSITAEPNNLPVFVQNAPTTVFEDASYSYTVSVSDADNDTFTVTAPILPSWLTFNQATGTLSCPSVPSAVVGNHAVQLLAEDIWGGTTYYDFTITVQNVPVTGTVTSSGSLKYSDLNTVQTPILKAVQVSESDATVVINTATVNGVDVRSYLQLGAGPSNYTVTVKSGQHAALLTLLRSNPGNVSVAIKVTDISTPASPIYVIETITVLNDSPTTTQQFPSSMTIIEDSATAYAQSGGADSTITFSEACSVVLNGTYKDYFTLVATDGTSRTYKLKCKDLASARAIIPGTSYSLTVTATSSASALTVTSTSLSVQATNILTTATVGGAKILTHASLQAYITSSAVIPNIATITLSESDPQSITLQTVTVNGSSVDKTYFTVSGSAGNYVLSVNTSAASQLLTRLSTLITSSSAYSMLMTFQVVEQGGNAFTQTITVAASNNIIKVSLKSTVTNVPSMVSYSVTGSVATVVMNYSATPVIDYVDYIISDANSAVGTRAVGGGIAYDGTTLPTMYVGVSLVKSMVYQSPGEWIVTYYESYSGITGSQSNSLTLKFSVRGAINFVLPTLNASYELLQALSIIGDYTAPAPFALPTITLSMPASQFNDGLFQLALTDSNINTLVNPASEAVYFSEKITYYANESKFPLLKNSGNMLLKDLPVVNGTALKPLRQRNAGVDRLSDSMIHELAYQLIGVSLMDDQIANGATLKASIDDYLTTALPAFVRSQLANCNGKTQNIAGASDLTTRANVSRELFMQIVESVVGGVNPATGSAKSSRLNSLFADSNLAGGKYGIKFIAGDTLRFSITIAPYSVGGVVQDVDYIVDGVQHAKQEARTVELVITMV